MILEVFEREIDSALADVNRQRVATIAALSSERKIILAELDSLRSVVTNDLKQARVDGTTDLELLVERRAQGFVDEAEGLVDVVFWRALTLLALALVGLAIVLRWTRSSAES